MISDARLLESTALRNLRQMSEARALKFYVNPPPEVVPSFLGRFQPDAIAVGPDGGIIIGLTSRRNPRSERQLAAIAKQVSDQKGWEFRAIFLNPPVDDTPPIARPTQDQLQVKFAEIEALTNGGHTEAAFLTAWATLESLARLAREGGEAGRVIGGLSALQAVQTLAEEGYLENDDADRLRAMVRLRNSVVHGDFSADVSAEEVKALLRQLRAIAAGIASVTGDKMSADDSRGGYIAP
jgi:REase_AHJR-like